MPHEEGLQIMKKYLDKLEGQSVTSENLYKLTEIVLKHNYFEFGQDVYQQILGTAIGTKFTPPYAKIFMAGLEEEIFKNPKFTPFLWLRYLDDIFCLWTEVVDKLKGFFSYLNEFHPSIKFTVEYSENQINFLDVVVTKSDSGEKLGSSLYTKPTDTHQYLHATSCHRAVYKNSIANGQAIRLKRICSDENELEQKVVSLEFRLVNRGYRAEKVRSGIQKINLIDRANLLIKKPKHQENSNKLVLTFHPTLNIVFNILKSAHRFIEMSQALKAVLPKPPRVAFCNPKTLRDKLVRSRIRQNDEAAVKYVRYWSLEKNLRVQLLERFLR